MLKRFIYDCLPEPGSLNEVCNGESFEAHCPIQEVIMVTKAEYGRMRSGRCIPPNRGEMGCSADATNIISNLCTGKPSCSVDLFDLTRDLYEIDQCQDAKPYLELHYICKRGEMIDCTSTLF